MPTTPIAAPGPPSATPELPGREQLRALGARRDGPALLHLGVQLGALVGFGAATAWLAAQGNGAWGLAALAAGVVVLTFFPMLHEAGHGTAFETPFWNELCVWLGAVAMGQAPSFFREFHWEHHRSTQDIAKDPEIADAPALLDDWPSNPIVYLGLVSGQLLMVGKAGFTIACALLPRPVWARQFPFVRREHQRRVAWESRATLAVWVAGVGLGLAFVPGFWAVLLAWPIAHVLLGFYLMAEHTGLPHEGSQLERTRTVPSNALVRWAMWNMPYHAEHHWQPGIPFHALPALHAQVAHALPHTSRGYLAFHAEAFARSLHLR